jgi:hypothetical protein
MKFTPQDTKTWFLPATEGSNDRIDERRRKTIIEFHIRDTMAVAEIGKPKRPD